MATVGDVSTELRLFISGDRLHLFSGMVNMFNGWKVQATLREYKRRGSLATSAPLPLFNQLQNDLKCYNDCYNFAQNGNMGASKKKRVVPAPGAPTHAKPKIAMRSRMRRIGNSKGVILSTRVIEAAGLNASDEIIIQAIDGAVYILPLQTGDVNTDLSTWDRQFKKAMKAGDRPEGDMFGELLNEFDTNEWR